MYYDHEFEGDQNQPCKTGVVKYNDKFDHDYNWDNAFCLKCQTKVIEEIYSDGSGRAYCKCVNFVPREWVCNQCRKHGDDTVHLRRDVFPCGAPWYSVLHPPDQFRHWCNDLEAGGDCMHFEDV